MATFHGLPATKQPSNHACLLGYFARAHAPRLLPLQAYFPRVPVNQVTMHSWLLPRLPRVVPSNQTTKQPYMLHAWLLGKFARSPGDQATNKLTKQTFLVTCFLPRRTQQPRAPNNQVPMRAWLLAYFAKAPNNQVIMHAWLLSYFAKAPSNQVSTHA